MPSRPSMPRSVALALVTIFSLAACGDDDPTPPGQENGLVSCGGSGTSFPALGASPPALSVVGRGTLTSRYTAELWVRGSTAYTSSWGLRGSNGVGNQVMLWDVSGNTPTPLGCVTLTGASTTGDVQVSDDGELLVVATERTNGSLGIYDVGTDPRKPALITRYLTPHTTEGVHTADVSRVGGTLYAFLSVDPPTPRLTIVSLADPAHPAEVFSQPMGTPFIHDVFVRDGILFTALWHEGVTIWDIGGGGAGGTVSSPVVLGNVPTVGGYAHNVAWFHDPNVTGPEGKRWLFVGEEGPASLFDFSSGDIHVVDVSDLENPLEVAFYSVPGAGTHNFSIDEANGVLYAAYYNGGVRALDIRGDLGTCTAEQQAPDGRCDLGLMGRELAVGPRDFTDPVFIWGVFYDGSHVYASDMINGLWKLTPVVR